MIDQVTLEGKLKRCTRYGIRSGVLSNMRGKFMRLIQALKSGQGDKSRCVYDYSYFVNKKQLFSLL